MPDKRMRAGDGQRRALTVQDRAASSAASSAKRSRAAPGALRPIVLTELEAEAIVVGLATASRDDPSLAEIARGIAAKLVTASGSATRDKLARAAANAAQPESVDWEDLLDIVERAIQDERELRIAYEDQTGEGTIRTIRPLAFAESRKGESVAAWCVLRQDFRHFRLERIAGIVALESFFKGQRDRLLERYMAIEGLP